MNPKRSTSAIPDEPGALNALVARALECWGLAGPKTDVSLVTRRENLVYRVTVANCDQRSDFALRLHRPGLRTALQLRSELAWMQAMAEAGIPVPAPLLSVHGALVETVDGFNFSLLDWIDAEPLGRESKLIHRAGAEATMVELGRQMARLHGAAAAWTPPADFDRPAWDFEGACRNNLGAETQGGTEGWEQTTSQEGTPWPLSGGVFTQVGGGTPGKAISLKGGKP